MSNAVTAHLLLGSCRNGKPRTPAMVRLYFGPKRVSALVLPADQEGWTVISIPSPETDAHCARVEEDVKMIPSSTQLSGPRQRL
jgi:hypothetical protein